MAQIGSFVPAEEAVIGLVDRIYTRVRTMESVSVGLSTFMIDVNQVLCMWTGITIVTPLHSLRCARSPSRCHRLWNVSVTCHCTLQVSLAIRSATERSLVILDEFGKGTCTADGISLFCACLKFWLAKGEACPHTFVSTHFHSVVQQQLLPASPQLKYMVILTDLPIVVNVLSTSQIWFTWWMVF